MNSMKDAPEIRDEVRKFVVSNYLSGSDNIKVGDDDSFLEKGIIDSIGVIELTNFIQTKYGIKIRVPDIVPENFDTLNNVVAYVQRKSRPEK